MRCAVFLISLTLLTSCSMSHDKKIKALEKKLTTARFSYPNGWQNAISVSNKILKYVPNHPEAHFEKGSALHHLGKYKEAIESFDQAIKYSHLAKAFYSISPETHRDMILNQSYYEKAQGLRVLGKLEDALKYFDLAIKNGLDHRYIHSERYEVLLELGRGFD